MTEKENLATCMAARADATAQRASVLAYGGGSSGLASADTTQADVKLAKMRDHASAVHLKAEENQASAMEALAETEQKVAIADRQAMMTARAEKKFTELDTDGDDRLEGSELDELAEWVWCSFRPDQQISKRQRDAEKAKILRRCDANDDGGIDREEFQLYYDKTTAAMYKYHLARAHPIPPTPAEAAAAADEAEEAAGQAIMSNRAEKKFNQLDADQSDTLEGKEVDALAEWVWCSFRPGQTITNEQRDAEKAKLLQRCDDNGDGSIDREEFQLYYDKVNTSMYKYHFGRAQPRAATNDEIEAIAAKADEEAGQAVMAARADKQFSQIIMSSRAEKKFNQLDADQSDSLEGREVDALAEWVWCSFRPGQTITDKDRTAEKEKILRRCDENGDGSIDRAEFQIYYDRVNAAMYKYHFGRAQDRVRGRAEIDMVAQKADKEIAQAIMSSRAEKKWQQLDLDGSDTLQGDEVDALAEWVWCSFRPGLRITREDRLEQKEKILRRCDENGDGSIDRAEFQLYYDRVNASMYKYHFGKARQARMSLAEENRLEALAAKADEEAGQAIMAARADKQFSQIIMSSRAEKKFNQLDADQSDSLEGSEVDALAEWVWCSFRPGQTITKDDREVTKEKILRRCDENGDGTIDRGEFAIYYDKTNAAMYKYHFGKAQAQQTTPAEMEEVAEKADDEVGQAIMSARAEKKFRRLDVNSSDSLEGSEVDDLAEWVWCSFRPGQTITKEDRDSEKEKIMRRCDENGDGSIDREEFQLYYDRTTAAMYKYHFGKAQQRAKSQAELEAAAAQADEEAGQAIMAARADKQFSQIIMSSRAEKKFKQLDADSNDRLEGDEVDALAEWVWCSFRPGQRITSTEREETKQKILRRCDEDDDGTIDRGEFNIYYDRIAAAMFKYHFGRAQHKAKSPLEMEEVAQKADEEVAQYIMSSRAEKKFAQLDTNDSGTLEGDEVSALAEWVWCSFRPGQTITDADRTAETEKILLRCDENDDGSVGREEFQLYYDRVNAAMFKYHFGRAHARKEPAEMQAVAAKADQEVAQTIMSARAEKKFIQLDANESGTLEGNEVDDLAEWVWKSFRPGQHMTREDRAAQKEKILRRCDENNDGVVDRAEFQVYYDKTAAAMHKYHFNRARTTRASLEDMKAFEAVADTADEEVGQAIMTARAEKKFKQLDEDRDDTLEGREVDALAEWVWCSFRPGQTITDKDRTAEKEKILRRCDENGDGSIDRAEFQIYYDRVNAAMYKYHFGKAQAQKTSASEMATVVDKADEDIAQAVMSARAEKKFKQLDQDGSDSLEGKELDSLAEWVWCSFRPGEVMSDADREAQKAKILQRCDDNGDGSIDREEFQLYYEKIAAAMYKYHFGKAHMKSSKAEKEAAVDRAEQEAGAAILTARADKQFSQIMMSARAEKKFKQLDADKSDSLEGEELDALAGWVWCSFRPGQTITYLDREVTKEKILRRCDENGDGSIDRTEFQIYYDKTAAAMYKYHFGHARAKRAPAEEIEEVAEKADEEVGQAIMVARAENKSNQLMMSARAEKKFNQLDADHSDSLEGKEVDALAEWVWCSFRPGQTITDKDRTAEKEKIMCRCDENGDGSIDRAEFQLYYDKVTSAMYKYHFGKAQHKSKSPHEIAEVAAIADQEAGQAIMSSRAEKKFKQLDVDGSDTLTGNEVDQLAEWVWCSFRPGQQITRAERDQQKDKILHRCDENGDGSIDREEFQLYYDRVNAAMFKYHLGRAQHKAKTPGEIAEIAAKADEEAGVAILSARANKQFDELVAASKAEKRRLGDAHERVLQNVMSSRAEKKFKQLDADSNDRLEGDEVDALAEWVWCSFRPGQRITSAEREETKQKILRRCDEDDDGTIDRGEFNIYYDRIAAAMFKYHFGRAQHKAKSPLEMEEVAQKADEEVAQYIMSSRAEKKFAQLDTNDSGTLEGDEIRELAGWVWCSFRRGEKITAAQCDAERDKIIQRCDDNGDGTIDREEFQLYYDRVNAAMFKYHFERARSDRAAKAYVEEVAAKADQEAAEAIMSARADKRFKQIMMSARAEKKFHQLDVNQDDTLQGEEVGELAKWVWCSFRPGQQISKEQQDAEKDKILQRCDENGDGSIDRAEFQIYYDRINAAIFKYKLGQVQGRSATPEGMEELAQVVDAADAEVGQYIMSARAEKKFKQLDNDASDSLEGSEVDQLAEWVWCSFRPGQTITKEDRDGEKEKLLHRCDENGDGSIDREEFQVYYDRVNAAMFKYHFSKGRGTSSATLSQEDKEEMAQAAAEADAEIAQIIMSARAEKKFKQLDADASDSLEGEEVDALAEWVWYSFHPKQRGRGQQTPTPQEVKQEKAKILRRCDEDGNGTIDRAEFTIYYHRISAAMHKFHSGNVQSQTSAEAAAWREALDREAAEAIAQHRQQRRTAAPVIGNHPEENLAPTFHHESAGNGDAANEIKERSTLPGYP